VRVRAKTETSRHGAHVAASLPQTVRRQLAAAIVPISLTNEFVVTRPMVTAQKKSFCATAVAHIGARRLEVASTERIILVRDPTRPTAALEG